MTTDQPYNLNPFYTIVDCHWGGGAPIPGSGQQETIWIWPGDSGSIFTQTTTFTGTCGNPSDVADQGTQINDGPNLTSQTFLGIYSGPTGDVSEPTITPCPTDNALFPKLPVANGQRINISASQDTPPGPPPDPTVTNIDFQTVANIFEITGPVTYEFPDTAIVSIAIEKFLGTGGFTVTDVGEFGRAIRLQGLIQTGLDLLVQGGGQAPEVLIYTIPPVVGP